MVLMGNFFLAGGGETKYDTNGTEKGKTLRRCLVAFGITNMRFFPQNPDVRCRFTPENMFTNQHLHRHLQHIMRL